MSTSRVLPNSGPGEGNAASMSRFVICSHCDETDNGAAVVNELALVLIFSGRSLPLLPLAVCPDVLGMDDVVGTGVEFGEVGF